MNKFYNHQKKKLLNHFKKNLMMKQKEKKELM